jgi:hypothetical protein
MNVPTGKVPVLESVRAAWAFLRENAAKLAPLAAIIAILSTPVAIFASRAALGGDLLGMLAANLASGLFTAMLFAGAFRLSFGGAAGPNIAGLSFGGDEMRLFGAGIVIAFFLFIVFMVAALPGILIIGMSLQPFAKEIEAAGQNPQAMVAVMQKALSANPAPLLGVIGLYAFIWMALTSRLFAAAPATFAEKQVRTFETWAWTKGNMLRIMAARLLVLLPAFMVMALGQGVVSAALGVDGNAGQALAQADPRAVVASFVGNFLMALVYFSTEAGLSAYLYRGLRPNTP